MKWTRKFPNSANNFDLVLATPQELDSKRMNTLLDGILEETHRGLTLSSRASTEFRRWFDKPETPLKSEAYVLLSNWFMTQSGDRHCTVASRCEDLWDALFPCRPVERLSSPEAGRNHVMVPAAFQSFWRRLLEAQGENVREADESSAEPNSAPPSRTDEAPAVSDVSTTDRLRAKFDKEGLHCEVEGSPRALADFLKMVSNWEAGQA
ncbi:MAG: hypothetical protein LAN70_17610 [Acidobacteriia bacterium]|nr:hypothetical protein [Terriglobia bacterium]